MPDDEREAVADGLFFEAHDLGAHVWRFGAHLILSTLIAALGLVGDSISVIIGAMLIALLMTPILAVAVSILLSDFRRLAISIAMLAAGTAATVAVAMPATEMGLWRLSAIGFLNTPWARIGVGRVDSSLPTLRPRKGDLPFHEVGVHYRRRLTRHFEIFHFLPQRA